MPIAYTSLEADGEQYGLIVQLILRILGLIDQFYAVASYRSTL